MVIPNSSFLEKTVVNWTLADRVVREELQVGVIYGSPTREVKRLLLAAADEVERVLRKPEPIVLFSDFGDNALIFHLLFWIKINNIIERKTILSELRFKVNDFFNTANIVIAFPQRDVHLDTAKPLKVVLDKTD
jgi:small-conductance mechanosensitive channel